MKNEIKKKRYRAVINIYIISTSNVSEADGDWKRGLNHLFSVDTRAIEGRGSRDN